RTSEVVRVGSSSNCLRWLNPCFFRLFSSIVRAPPGGALLPVPLSRYTSPTPLTGIGSVLPTCVFIPTVANASGSPAGSSPIWERPWTSPDLDHTHPVRPATKLTTSPTPRTHARFMPLPLPAVAGTARLARQDGRIPPNPIPSAAHLTTDVPLRARTITPVRPRSTGSPAFSRES